MRSWWLSMCSVVVVAGCVDEPMGPSEPLAEAPRPSMAVTYGPTLVFSSITELEPYAGATDASPAALDRDGRVVGTSGGRAVIWEEGTPNDLGLPEGASSHTFTAINDDGQLLARAIVDGTWRTFLWDDGNVEEIASLAGPDYAVVCVTNADRIYGTIERSGMTAAFVWEAGAITELPDAPGYLGSSVDACNTSGLVVGEGYLDERRDVDAAATFVVWESGQYAWHGDSPHPFNNVWRGVTASGDAYLTNIDAGDQTWRWRGGQVTTFPPDAEYRPWRYTVAVSSGGLLLGTVDEAAAGWGIWKDEVFHTLDDGVVSHCSLIADGAHVVCEGPGRQRPFVGHIDFGSSPPGNNRVSDLSVAGISASSVTLTWTQVDDGTGSPAWYRVKYATPPIDWRTGTIGCERTMRGTEIGAPMSCKVDGLDSQAAYEFQLMSFRVEDGVWADAEYSNRAATETGAYEVADLWAVNSNTTTMTVRWTQVADGTGSPAHYRVKYAVPPISYGSATRACTIQGEEIGALLSCTIEGIDPGTWYDVQLMSYRVEDGRWVDAKRSNVVTSRTSGAAPNAAVNNLRVAGSDYENGTSSALLEWTQVDDGRGNPASYRLRYGSPLERWKDGTLGCDRTGDHVGSTIACRISGLTPGVRYDFQLMSFGVEDGVWVNARYSNVASATMPAN